MKRRDSSSPMKLPGTRSGAPCHPSRRRRRRSGEDVRLFLLSFAAFFICFYTMIA
ncbi:hypothetical protein AB5I41_06655 [Sphingomonas sp. MMS24-JH45]